MDLKKGCAVIFDNFTRSGNHDAEFINLEFKKFIHGDNIALYAFMLYGHARYKQLVPLLGKVAPEEAQSDSGVAGMPNTVQRSSHVSKKRSGSTTPGYSSVGNSSSNHTITIVRNEQENGLQRLSMKIETARARMQAIKDFLNEGEHTVRNYRRRERGTAARVSQFTCKH